MDENEKSTYLPSEMAEEIQALKDYIGLGGGTNLDEIAFGKMTETELYQATSNPGTTDPRHYEAIAEAINLLDEAILYHDYDIFKEKTIEHNGEYIAFDDDAYGYSMVRVNVADGGGLVASVEGTCLVIESGASVDSSNGLSVLAL